MITPGSGKHPLLSHSWQAPFSQPEDSCSQALFHYLSRGEICLQSSWMNSSLALTAAGSRSSPPPERVLVILCSIWSPMFDHGCLFSCHLPAHIIHTQRNQTGSVGMCRFGCLFMLRLCTACILFSMYSFMYNRPLAFYCVCCVCVWEDACLFWFRAVEMHVCFSVCVGTSGRAVCKYAVDTSPLGHRVSH